jgi:hypothetical protein
MIDFTPDLFHQSAYLNLTRHSGSGGRANDIVHTGIQRQTFLGLNTGALEKFPRFIETTSDGVDGAPAGVEPTTYRSGVESSLRRR